MISFVTWIHDRLHQYSQVLPVNLNRAPINSEFVLLDVGSTDGLQDYLHSIHDPRLKYWYQPADAHKRHFAKLYNRAASLATGNILVFLDADNAIGVDYASEVLANCTLTQFVWAFSGDWNDGTPGRLAFQRDVFWSLGGFDESLGPVGYQDVDLIERAKAYGIKMRFFQRPEVVGWAVRNDRRDTMRCLGLTLQDWERINAANAKQSRANIAAGRLVANGATSRHPPGTAGGSHAVAAGEGPTHGS